MASNRVQLSRNLFLDEYIPKHLFDSYNVAVLVGMLDKRLIESDQKLRNYFGYVTINNWRNKGGRTASGIRTLNMPYYSPTSQHSFGRASDKVFKDVHAAEVRSYIRKHWKELGISAIENNVNWVHTDVRWRLDGKLFEFNP